MNINYLIMLLLLEISQKVLIPPTNNKKPAGHWTVDGSKNIRKFFDSLALSWNKDPLNPDTWYQFGLEDLSKAQVLFNNINNNNKYLLLYLMIYFVLFLMKGLSILKHYGNSIIKMLMGVYPDIGFDELKFDRVYRTFIIIFIIKIIHNYP